jgi:GNAT superfamily N-acetyltransferase
MAIEEEATVVARVKDQVFIYKYENEERDQVEYFMIDYSIELSTPEDFQSFCPAFMGFCALSYLEDWAAIETSILYVSPNFRRMGVAEQLYDAILDDGQIVICGWSHNPKSRALWKKMMSNPKYVIWAQDMNDIDRISDVWFDEEDEMVCNLKVYVDIKVKTCKEDVRLVAINPEKV